MTSKSKDSPAVSTIVTAATVILINKGLRFKLRDFKQRDVWVLSYRARTFSHFAAFRMEPPPLLKRQPSVFPYILNIEDGSGTVFDASISLQGVGKADTYRSGRWEKALLRQVGRK